jgi:hypothetical protein
VIAQARAELVKVRSTRTTFGLTIALVALLLAFVLLVGLVSPLSDLSEPVNQRDFFGLAGFASLFSALAGVLLVTSEYRFGTIRPTFLVTPKRHRVLAAKVAAASVVGCILGIAGLVLAFGLGSAILSGRGVELALDDSEVAVLLIGTPVASGLWGAIGVGLGSIVRNQVGALVGLLAWLLVVEGLLISLVPSVGRLTPGQAGDALSGGTNDNLVPPAAGGALLVAWAAALLAVGIGLTARRDVD